MITVFPAIPLNVTSNLDTADVIVEPLITVSIVTIAWPCVPCSVGDTATGATSLAASICAVKTIVSAFAEGIINDIAALIVSAVIRTQRANLFISSLLVGLLVPASPHGTICK
jgi:hypothetical protein